MVQEAEAIARDDLVALAETRDPASRETYLSVFVDLSDPGHGDQLAARAAQVRAAVGDPELRGNFDEALRAAERALTELAAGDARGAAVFASPAQDGFLQAFPLAAPVDTGLVLDSSPYIRPLARFSDRHEAFVLALLDGDHACVYLVEDAAVAEERSERSGLTGRHGKGGMSQMRFQRKRRGAMERFLDKVAEDVAALLREDGARRLVVAGPGQAKRRLLDHLPGDTGDALLAVEDVDFDDASEIELVRRFVGLARRDEDDTSGWAVGMLRGRLMRGELATSGAFPVARAARDGRVDTLVILEGYEAGGRKCERDDTLFEVGEVCGVCGDEGTKVDLLEEAVEYAVRSEAEVEFVPESEFLRDLGGVGALLRW